MTPRQHESAYVTPGGALRSRLVSEQMMEIFEIGPAQFYRLLAQGKFDRFELKPKIGRRAWSGKLLQQYFDGERISLKRIA